jgi:hypothetical protein
MFNIKNNLSIFALFISIFSFLIAIIFGEDSLGGAEHDFKYHEKYFFYFSQDFKKTFYEYGLNYEVRNSPIFYIFFSQLIEFGINTNDLKYFNIIVIFPIIYYFYKCLELKSYLIDCNSKLLFTSCIFLSPTIRSLINYPYPILWAFCFFLISIFFFLKFKKIKKSKTKNAILCICNLSIASYFTPNFSVFIFYFFFYFYLYFGLSKRFIVLLTFSFLLALPAFLFLIWKDFYLFRNNVFELSFFEKINFTNKIIIILSFIILFFIPLLKKINFSMNKIKSKYFFISLLFISICIIFFDYKSGAGGGIFFKLSIILFENNLLVYLIFVFSILFFYFNNLINLNNLILFIILILYNLQYSIYYKYFDPLIFIIILFLMKHNVQIFISSNKIAKKYFIFYIIFLIINIFKSNFYRILI